jgi:hypothetical protein
MSVVTHRFLKESFSTLGYIRGYLVGGIKDVA